MLNISHNQLNKKVSLKRYRSFNKSYNSKYNDLFSRFLGLFAILVLLILFLPWTQNVSGNGFVTTLTPDQRPQTIQSPIPGKLEKWFVKEGDYVTKGDTILFISEIKNEYQDPRLVERTNEQRDAKSRSVVSYKEKIKALEDQVNALSNERQLKLSQAENKLKQAQFRVKSDSIDYEAAQTNLAIAQRQFERTTALQ
ncbi:MAG: biotin/lipoyl-binding protein, partial [Flavobacteriaceae bacterium]|nr:biotin/lipoyl-binding protein [Flavobacteriaceae bacterium]